MLKSAMIAAALSLAAMPLAQAQDAPMMCDEATFMKMDTQVDAMSDPSMQEMKNTAAAEMSMAKDAQHMKDADKCMEHLQKAADAIAMKM